MNTERVATLLASGLSVSSVASIIGVSPGRISQIKEEPGFSDLYAGKVAETETKDAEEVAISARYLEAEHLLLKQVIQMAPLSELRDVTAALRVVAERQEKSKMRTNPIMQGGPVYNTVVQLSLPTHAVPELQFSATKEVISIQDRALTPLSSRGVVNLFAAMDADKGKEEENDTRTSIRNTEDSNTEALPNHSTEAKRGSDGLAALLNGARSFLSSSTTKEVLGMGA